jgi:hypothetical protein
MRWIEDLLNFCDSPAEPGRPLRLSFKLLLCHRRVAVAAFTIAQMSAIKIKAPSEQAIRASLLGSAPMFSKSFSASALAWQSSEWLYLCARRNLKR